VYRTEERASEEVVAIKSGHLDSIQEMSPTQFPTKEHCPFLDSYDDYNLL
jgi:hypothetical protein